MTTLTLKHDADIADIAFFFFLNSSQAYVILELFNKKSVYNGKMDNYLRNYSNCLGSLYICPC